MLLTITKMDGKGRNFNTLETVLVSACSFEGYRFYLRCNEIDSDTISEHE